MVQTNGLLLSIGAVATCGLATMLVFGGGGSTERPAFVTEITRQIAQAAPGTVRVAPDGWRDYARAAPPAQALPEVVRSMRPTSSRAPAAAMPSDRAGITRELQRQLARVGCYEGEITGSWTPGTRRAMQAFTDQVNAALPTTEPDQILLALVQSHTGRACGACPSGQSVSGDGRCVPSAILAKAPEKGRSTGASGAAPSREAAVITGWGATTSVTAVPPVAHAAPLEGRMALAGPGMDAGTAADDAQAAPPAATPPVPRPAPVQMPKRSGSGKFGTSIFKALDRSGT